MLGRSFNWNGIDFGAHGVEVLRPVRPLRPPVLVPQVRAAGTDGAFLGAPTYQPLRLQIPCAVRAALTDGAQGPAFTRERDLSAQLASKESAPLWFDHPHNWRDYQYMATAVGAPAIQWSGTLEGRAVFEFIIPSPFLEERAEITATESSGLSDSLLVGGAYDPAPVFTITGLDAGATTLTITNSLTSQTLTWTGAADASDMRIDTAARTVHRWSGSAWVLDNSGLNPLDFPMLKVSGSFNVITISGSVTAGVTTLQTVWRQLH